MNNDSTLNTLLNQEQINWDNLQLQVGTDQVKSTTITDSVKQYDSSDKPGYVILTPGHPKLPVPPPDADPQGLAMAGSLAQHYAGEILTTANSFPIPDDKFTDAAEAALANLSDEQIAQIGGGLPKEEVVKMVRFSMLNPDANFPPGIKNAATQILQNVTATVGPPSPFIAIIGNQLINSSYNALFKAELLKSGLPPAAQQQLIAAHDMPQFVASLSPAMQTLLKNAEATAFSETQKEYGIPNDWKVPRDTTGFEKGVSLALETKTNDALYNMYYINGQISRADYNDLRSMIFVPGSKPANAANLTPVLNQVLSNTKNQVQNDWGFPDSYAPTTKSTEFNSIITGAFYSIATKAIASQTPPLSATDQAALTTALGSLETRAALSPALSAILSSIIKLATGKVQAQYSLPEDWTPDVGMLANAEKLNTPALQFTKSALAMGFEALSNLKSLGSIPMPTTNASVTTTPAATKSNTSLAAGPATTSSAGPAGGMPGGGLLMNYLRIVSMALASMQEMQFSASIIESNVSNMLQRIQTDTNLSQITARKAELQQVMAKEAKMAALGPFKFIMMIILAILMVMSEGMLGFLFTCVLALNSIAQCHGNVMQMDLLGDLAKTVGEIGSATGVKVLGNIFTILVNLAVLILQPVVVILDLAVGQGSWVSSTLQAFGVPKDIAGYLTMAAQVVFMIGSIIAAVFTGGASLEAAMAPILGMLGNASSQIAAAVLKVVVRVVDFLVTFLEKYSQGSSVLSAIVKLLQKVSNYFGDKIPKLLSDQIDIDKCMNDVKQAESTLSDCKEDTGRIQAVVNRAEKSVSALTKKFATLQQESDTTPDDLDAAAHDLDIAKDDLVSAKNNLKAAKDLEKQAEKDLKSKMEVMGKSFEKASARVSKIFQLGQYAINVSQNAETANNNILKGEIALIQAALNAYMEQSDASIKVIQSLIQKLLQGLQELGKDISGLGKQMQEAWAKQSQAMTAFASAASKG